MVRRRVRRGKAGHSRRRVRNTFRTVVTWALVGLAGVFLCRILVRPVVLDRQEVAEIRRLSREVAVAEEQNKALRRRVRVLNTPKGVEVEARRLGWVRDGEVLIQTSGMPALEPAKDPAAPPATPSLSAAQAQGGFLRRTYNLASRALANVRGRPSKGTPARPLEPAQRP